MNQHENLCRQLCALLNDAKAQDIVTIPLARALPLPIP